MNKAHVPINWENYPSDETPLNERNLNKMDSAIGIIDDNVVTLDATKATKTEVATLVADVTFEESTGIITITKKNGSKITIDTQMEKIAINFDYNPTTQQIILTLIDGTKQYIDLSALITQYEFLDSDTVAFYIDKDGKVSAIVKEGSIEEKHLEPNYLAKIKVEVAKAESSQQAAAKSEANAKASENAAKASETAAKTSETNAKASETAAAKSATAAEASESNAKVSETSASESSATATEKASSASQSADTAAEKADIATQKAAEIIGKAESAEESATKAQSYAVGGTGSREGEDSDNAKYYYQQAKDVSEGLKGGLQPHGTVAFADLPALADVSTGWMFNISDEFTTTDDFKEGAGNVIPAGANIYKTSDEKWDVLAGTPVTGIKGVNEDSFRRGNVVLTAKDVGAVSTGGDTAENTATFTSSDVADGSASAWTTVSKLSSGEKHSSIFAKVSQMFKNVRYLYKMLGTTDISKIGNGTCTGAISSLNSGLANKYFIKIMKSDWSGIMGSLMPMFNINNDNMIDLIAHNEQNDTYPGVRVARASADYDGNNIPDTYLKKSDAKNNVSALSNTATNYNDQTPVVQYFTVPDDGYYLITGLVTFSSNANGFREVFITNTTSNYVMGRVRVPAVSGGASTLQVTSGGTFGPGQTGTLSTYQNSGSNLNVQEWLNMVKIAPKL
jgi:chemotaxis protein histidine kinase CheA|nr:MAG: C1q domain protein [Bacteriophage sp.]